MDICEPRDLHAELTQLSHYVYCFTPKHHGAGLKTDSRWLPSLSRPDEFAVFDMADRHQISDDGGKLYGLRISVTGSEREILELGTRHEVIARFWDERGQPHWHGYPLWPVDSGDSPNRKGEKHRPARKVFQRMVDAQVLNRVEAGRLRTGRHIRNLRGVAE